MKFYQETQTRRYFLFICVFTGLLFFLVFFLIGLHGREAQDLLLEREQSLASALAEQGVPADVIALALKNTTVTEAGTTILKQIGHTEQASPWLFPSVSRTMTAFARTSLCIMAALGIALLFVSIRFLKKREQLYQTAADTITQFSEGRFDTHLPGKENGTLFQLFASIEGLATALQAQNDREHHTKEFLKGTVSDISHQLKTPLSALQMYTEIILDEPENQDAVKTFAGKSMQALERPPALLPKGQQR